MAAAIPPSQSYFDQTYTSSAAEKYHLSLQISESRLIYVLINISLNKVLCVEEYLYESNSFAQLEERLKKIFVIGFFKLPFKSVSIYYVGKYSTFIPYDLYEQKEERNFLQLNFRLEADSITSSDKLDIIEAYTIFAVPAFLPQLFNESFVNYQLKHYSTPLLHQFLALNRIFNEEAVYLNIQKKHFEMIVGDKGKLLFYNSFDYSNAEDFLYFMLYAMEKLNLSNEKTAVFLVGEIETNSELYRLLYKYVKELKMLGRPKNLIYSSSLSNIPESFYYNLFSQYLCE